MKRDTSFSSEESDALNFFTVRLKKLTVRSVGRHVCGDTCSSMCGLLIRLQELSQDYIKLHLRTSEVLRERIKVVLLYLPQPGSCSPPAAAASRCCSMRRRLHERRESEVVQLDRNAEQLRRFGSETKMKKKKKKKTKKKKKKKSCCLFRPWKHHHIS
ncbi:hypothetical protein F2P81_018924 [Scophthalmus maximus]|uniref:Uncharacterized protein n=1 Tax=Scophthalmus maximus TaxID=52904 RepID=A0A6A4SB20_SCOMX|nr:hypothetical protein F2P81_018924 [Scophthalmus maximus]